MKKQIVASSGAVIVLLAAGCTSNNNAGQVNSLQSKIKSLQRELASDQMHIASLERGLSRDQDILQAARATQIKVVRGLEAKLKREQSIASKGATSGTGR